MLDDKFAFAEKARSLSLSVPKSFKITAPEQVLNFDFSNEKNKYILKVSPMTQVSLEHDQATLATLLKRQQHLSRVYLSEEKPCRIHPWKNTALTVPCEMESRMYCCCESSAFKSTTKMLISLNYAMVNHFVTEMRLTAGFLWLHPGSWRNCLRDRVQPRTHLHYYVLQTIQGADAISVESLWLNFATSSW